MEPVNIYINIIVGNVTGSAVIQGGSNNNAQLVSPDFMPELVNALRILYSKSGSFCENAN